ncbi:hypothetical protein, partial [Novosphingobium sp. KN65.2]|uniref:hypothetical protein n=1 Tax=Novosphingobium sp. KN65.2 TaxID=1478134 RepID=UPI000A58760F
MKPMLPAASIEKIDRLKGNMIELQSAQARHFLVVATTAKISISGLLASKMRHLETGNAIPARITRGNMKARLGHSGLPCGLRLTGQRYAKSFTPISDRRLHCAFFIAIPAIQFALCSNQILEASKGTLAKENILSSLKQLRKFFGDKCQSQGFAEIEIAAMGHRN